ncbi:MAG: hypothetical protein AB7G24_13995 [Novosphingobium sp.]
MPRIQGDSWKFPATITAAAGAMMVVQPAAALPSYARQTGEPCTSCHVGGFGPQLTPHGRDFKLGGYSDSLGSFKVPLSAMVVANFTHTKKDQTAPISGHDGSNDNWALQEASIFLAGRLLPGLGTFIQTTYSEIDRAVAFDHADIRYAHTLQLGGKDLLLGIDINNNPTVQDPYNSVGAWSFPYTASDLGVGHLGGAFMTGGIEHQAVGASLYGMYDNHVYAEVGGYRSLSTGALDFLGVEDEAGKLSGVAPYWRLALQNDWKGQSASIGLIGMNGKLHPDRLPGPTNNYHDIGIDASYQFLGNRKDVFSLNASHIWEKQNLGWSEAMGEVSRRRQKLRQWNADVSWYHNNSYGLTAGLFGLSGTRDPLLNAPEEDFGSANGKPDTNGFILQADWTPLGREDSPLAPNVNLRLGLQYTGYTKFNGAKHDYDGFGRDAADNNTINAFVWLAF